MSNILAELGLKRLLGESKFKINKGDQARALKQPDRIEKLAQQYVTKALEASPSNLQYVDLEWVFPILENPNHDLEELSQEAGDQLVNVLQIRNTLRNEAPKDGMLAGPLTMTKAPGVSQSPRIRFLWACRIADNPLHIFELLRTGQIAGPDVRALIALYPDMYQMVVQALLIKVIEEFTDKPLTRSFTLGLSQLLQTPVISTETLMRYQIPEAPKPQTNINVPQTPKDVETI